MNCDECTKTVENDFNRALDTTIERSIYPGTDHPVVQPANFEL